MKVVMLEDLAAHFKLKTQVSICHSYSGDIIDKTASVTCQELPTKVSFISHFALLPLGITSLTYQQKEL